MPLTLAPLLLLLLLPLIPPLLRLPPLLLLVLVPALPLRLILDPGGDGGGGGPLPLLLLLLLLLPAPARSTLLTTSRARPWTRHPAVPAPSPHSCRKMSESPTVQVGQ